MDYTVLLTTGLACRQLNEIVRWLPARSHHLPASFVDLNFPDFQIE